MSSEEDILKNVTDPVVRQIFLAEFERLRKMGKTFIAPSIPPVPTPAIPEAPKVELPKVELPKVELPKVEAPTVTPFPNPLQTVTVDPGASKVVYLQKIPTDCIGFVQAVGNTSFDDAYLKWTIDGKPVIDSNIDWDIANINAVKQMVPWLTVKEEVKWEGFNNGGLACKFQVLCDGFWTRKTVLEALLKMGLPIGEF